MSRKSALQNNFMSEIFDQDQRKILSLGDWRKEYVQIKKKLLSSERDINPQKSLVYNSASVLKADLINLTRLEEKRDFDREKERDKIFKEVKFLKDETLNLKESLKCFEKSPQYLYKIQEQTEQLESKFSEFKSGMMELYDDLTEDYEVLFHDLKVFESDDLSRFNTQKEHQANQSKQNQGNKDQVIQEDIYGESIEQELKEIIEDQEIDQDDEKLQGQIKLIDEVMEKQKHRMEKIDQKLVQNGGRNCGWSDEDQKEFLRLKISHKGQIQKQSFLNDCKVVLGFMEERKIVEHIEKYLKMENYEEEKKKIMEEYKILKEKRKKIVCQMYEKEEQEKKKFEVENQKKKEENEKEKERKRREIQQWKIRKEAIKEISQEQILQEQKEKEKEKYWQEYEKQKIKKEMINIYKENRKLEKELENQTPNLNTPVITKEQKEKIKQREQEIIQKKISILNAKKEKEEQQKLKQIQIEEDKKIKFSYIDNKLTQPTAAFQGHQRDKNDIIENKVANTFGGQIVRNSGRATASWRQGV